MRKPIPIIVSLYIQKSLQRAKTGGRWEKWKKI
jgi:hypothetical protein